ncbi:unnamed protein product [Cochlearia groenlandica]
MKLQGMILVAILFYLSYMQQLVNGQSWPGCLDRCGNVTIEYPFGISPGCYHAEDPTFSLTCNEKGKLLFSNVEIINITHNGELRVKFNTSITCYDDQGNLNGSRYYDYRLGNLSLSTRNVFTLVGCNAYSILTTFGNQDYSTGCMSLCSSLPAPTRKCNGEGCCSTDVSIPLDKLKVRATSVRFKDMISVYHFNPCTYAFLVEDGNFNFSSSEDLMNLRGVTEFPVVLDWSIGKQTCGKFLSKPICGNNSECSNSTRGVGYNCKCREGFEGNPYLPDGCKDIDECTHTIHKHDCLFPATCENIRASFICKCPPGHGPYVPNITNSCKPIDKPIYLSWTLIFLGTTIGFLVILLVVSCIQQRMKHRKDIELRQQFFQQNGGGMLMQRLSGAGASNVDVKLFTEECMNEATDGYDESRILGQGGQGTVYKGILPDNSIVAIKKARLGDNSQVEQFINEVLVLSQINHRNVVKLLGCCLETEVPLLVYEFITSGTLFDHLHGSMFGSSLTWEHRLRIAIEIAGTLAYLHSSASIPIIHRDVKTANILLDENLTAKVADFGASRLIPMDKEELATMVQGTLGYLDPEYYNTGLLNEKSDVYSFGVVLMELLSGQKALCFERQQTSKHIASYFGSAMKENRLHEVIDEQVKYEDNKREIHDAVRVAVACTRITGEERPTMKDVAAELEGLRATKSKHKWSDRYPEPKASNHHLLGVDILSEQGETSSSIGYDSIKNAAILDIEAGR